MWKPETNNKISYKIAPNGWTTKRKKNNIHGDIRTLLGKDFEVEKMMRFLREIKMFKEI